MWLHIRRSAESNGFKNLNEKKKLDEKALIPLPPTGSTSVFCAKVEGGAFSAAGQAYRGLALGKDNFTKC